ncbi:uncharacterized protein At5g01610-like [Syzygium oleosum]|uniref:uncharacterized protein At5g01610-like n=1 Tax=Syzygium oleosum TaxID=219896 RepID=UPI0024BA11B7|nr:uncharacterized protein At5g01610-like [Syzygium oleosum]XP_056174121.1 uncharacterized protein At5g01610-like [Syzygium oleosum]XP_056174126.1 uncharacterized protein At5g01610-like [Syzygium oleosum]XP_056174131.1 uncharacterized protein At5g01610-like [Syzygium oleosum]XP_056174134.1 uncharacterized protein At5g01610-like [Syzygium oleosum]
MSPSLILAALSLLLLLFSAADAAAASPLASAAGDGDDDDGRSAYEVLEGFNFPEGILPKGVTGYELDRPTGKFRAYLGGSCSFSLEGSYQLRYKSTISGYISQNKLTSLTGVSVKVLFLWLNIVEVERVGDELEFSVGIASASFTIDNFFESPQCGCGFDCVGGGGARKIRMKALASSI